MSKNIGISKQTFFVMGTYLCVILFHSYSVLSSLAAAISVFLIQILAFLILPVAAKYTKKTLFTYLTVLFTVIFAVIIYRIFGLIPMSGITISAAPFPDPAFLLIMVPLLIDQSSHPSLYKPRSSVRLAFTFFVMIMFVSFLREVLGYGTLSGVRVIPESLRPVQFLTHTSGAALLLFILTFMTLFFYRRITGRPQVLAVLEEPGQMGKQPVLVRKVELANLYTALIWFFVTASIMMILYYLSEYMYPSFYSGTAVYSFDIVFAAAAILQGAVTYFLHLITGRRNPYISRILSSSWLIPVQNIILILPYSSTMINTVMKADAFGVPAGLFVYLACMWILAVISRLFLRSVKRKLLFGSRPDLLSGLLFLLLIAGLILMILAGLNIVPESRL